MVANVTAPAECQQPRRVRVAGVTVDVVNLQSAEPAAALAPPPVTVEHEPADPRPPTG